MKRSAPVLVKKARLRPVQALQYWKRQSEEEEHKVDTDPGSLLGVPPMEVGPGELGDHLVPPEDNTNSLVQIQ